MGYLLGTVCEFRALKSPHGLQVPSDFGTKCSGLAQSECDLRTIPFLSMSRKQSFATINFSLVKRLGQANTGLPVVTMTWGNAAFIIGNLSEGLCNDSTLNPYRAVGLFTAVKGIQVVEYSGDNVFWKVLRTRRFWFKKSAPIISKVTFATRKVHFFFHFQGAFIFREDVGSQVGGDCPIGLFRGT